MIKLKAPGVYCSLCSKGYILSFICLVFFSCGGGSGNEQEQRRSSGQDSVSEEASGANEQRVDTTGWNTYRNDDYNFSAKYPPEWKVAEQEEPFQIFNIYSPEHANEFELPIKIHNDPVLSHVSFFPKGYGTELPAGQVKKLEEWKGYVSTDFEVDKRRPDVLLTEDGEAWGYLLRTLTPPEGWTENGFIFIEIKTTDVSFTCINVDSGEEKPLNECDPLAGDRVKRTGKLSPDDKRKVLKIIETLHFFDDKSERRPLEDLIKVDNPKPDETIAPPLKIHGEAKGYWYFEGDFPVELVDSNGQVIGQGIARATGEWMTENFVPFEATINYENPRDGEGYLLLKRSNASGMPEHDRTYRIPVKFK